MLSSLVKIPGPRDICGPMQNVSHVPYLSRINDGREDISQGDPSTLCIDLILDSNLLFHKFLLIATRSITSEVLVDLDSIRNKPRSIFSSNMHFKSKVIQKTPSEALDITIKLYLAPICPCKVA